MILLLGLDSQFVGLEAIITAVTDMYPQYRKGMKRQYLLFTIVGVSFCVGLTMCLDVSTHYFSVQSKYKWLRVVYTYLHYSIITVHLVYVYYGFAFANVLHSDGYTVSHILYSGHYIG